MTARRRLALALVLVALAPPASGGAGATGMQATTAADDRGAIAALYPNPLADGDAGEYVVLSVPPGTEPGRLALADGEDRVRLPNGTAGGRVVVTGNRSALPRGVEGAVVEFDGWTALANGGERLRLLAGGRVLDRVGYTDAPEGEVGRPDGDGLAWRPVGATDFDPLAAGPARGRAFVLPDAPAVPVSVLRSADRRILLAGYTLSSRRVADALIAAHERGVEVAVLVDGGPVGGFTNGSVAVLDRLAAANVSVTAMGGPAARYQFHHAKYAVVDDRAVVLTENWKPAGTGGHASRGWGVVLDQARIVERLAATFRADATWRDGRSWERHRETVDAKRIPPSGGSFPSRFDPASFRARRAELLVAPDNAAGRVRSVIGNASESIRIVQVSIDGLNNTLLQASLDAARRGVDVRILLSSAWYAKADNRALARNLTALADREDLPIEVRLADPNGRYEKVHAKGVLVDGEHVVIGSLNWNDDAFYENREVALLLTGEGVAGYFGQVFAADWQGGRRLLAAGLLALLAAAVALALVVGRRITFRG